MEMVRKLLIAVGFLSMFQVAQAAAPDARDNTPDVAIGGTWLFDFTFTNIGSGEVDFYINQFGPFVTFKTSYGDGGLGFTAARYALLHITDGCVPNYISTETTETSMAGVIECTDGSGESGTFTASFVGTDAIPRQFRPAPGAIGASGVVNK
jgi:hypothetical protein